MKKESVKKILEVLPFFQKILPHSEIEFQSHGYLTLGVEVEIQLIDKESLDLTSRAEEFLAAGVEIKKLKPEFYLSTVEINTDKCNNVVEVEEDLKNSFNEINKVADSLGISLATTGCHPLSKYADCIITPSPRYNKLIDRNQWLTRRMTVYGLHIHIGMKNGDDCIRFNNFFLYFLPHLIALSASSPFWQGTDTGLSSCRPTTYESLPTAGHPYTVRNWEEFEQLYKTLKRCNAISSMKDLWWDLRPSPTYGTLEIRVCDDTATLAETVAIVAFVHLLANWFNDHGNWINQFPIPKHWMTRENKWRAMRYGLEAEIITDIDGSTKLIREDILDWLEKLKPYTKKLGYKNYIETIKEIIKKGNSSTRQKDIYNQSGSLTEVTRFNIKEFLNQQPIWRS